MEYGLHSLSTDANNAFNPRAQKDPMFDLLVRVSVWGLIALALTHCKTIQNRSPALQPLPDLGNTDPGGESSPTGRVAARWVVLESDTTSSRLVGLEPEKVPTGFVVVVPPENGSVTLNPTTGGVDYEPTTRYVGADRFEYRAFYGTEIGPLNSVEIQVTGRLLPYTNPLHYADVNGDGIVSPLDALRIINRLNAEILDLSAPENNEDRLFLDVNGDGILSVSDPLAVIQALNANGTGAVQCQRGEVAVRGICVRLGQAGDSCDAVCSGHGGCDSGETRTVGSGSSSQSCGELADQFFTAKGNASSENGTVSLPGLAIGCSVDSNGNPLLGEAPTSCDAKLAGIRRYCVCAGAAD